MTVVNYLLKKKIIFAKLKICTMKKITKTQEIGEQKKLHVIEKSPFHILEDNENFYICIGHHVVVEQVYNNVESALKRVNNTDIDLIIGLQLSMVELLQKKVVDNE